MIPDWQLPTGADRGLWDYISSERLAREYDKSLADSPLLGVDLDFAGRHFHPPGRLVDLGCGTGRGVVHFARRGFQCLGVDLSTSMLDILREKADREGLAVERLEANLVELDAIPAGKFDYALCLFSTLGMIRGVDCRRRFLGHARRILKGGGLFVVHVHNTHYRFGRGLGKRGVAPGDRTMPQHRGGAELTIHHYARGEILSELTLAGFRVTELLPISIRRDCRLPLAWFLPTVRAHGYLVAAQAG